MTGFELYSERKRRAERGGLPAPFVYDDLPDAFRNQVVHILSDAIGSCPTQAEEEWHGYNARGNRRAWQAVHDRLARELGLRSLTNQTFDPRQACIDFFLAAETDTALDVIEFSFIYIVAVLGKHDTYDRKKLGIEQSADDAVNELNQRFLRHGLGYEYVNGRIIRKDSQYLHIEAVEPAIKLLHEGGFDGALQEFMSAHGHYRHGRHKEAIQDALKAFESTMKTICDQQAWRYAPSDGAKKLTQIVFDAGLVRASLHSQFTALASVLESGLPTIRNKTSGHGQGSKPVAIPAHLAAFALHLAAANIVFLVDCRNAMK